MPPSLIKPVTSDVINAWKSFNVLVIGDVMLDCYLNGNADRLCQEAPVPIVTVNQRQDFPGGAANVAANISSLEANVTLLSVVGNDESGDRLKVILEQQGIATTNLLSTVERTTLSKQRVMADSHLIVRFDQGSTDAIASPLEQKLVHHLRRLFPESDVVLVSDYGYGVITPLVIDTLITLQNQYSRTLVIDSKHLQSYQAIGATAVKPNYTEAINLLKLPKQTQHVAAQVYLYGDDLLRLTGARIVAVTLDVEGVIVFERKQKPICITATPAPTSQTAGAGDTFISAFALALAASGSTSVAASLASTATAIVVTHFGTTTCSAQALYQTGVADLGNELKVV